MTARCRRNLLLVLALTFATGCASGSANAAKESELGAPTRGGTQAITYTVDVSDHAAGTVDIGIEIPDAGEGPTGFAIPKNWAGLSNIPTLITDVRATDSSGNHYEVRHPAPEHWVVEHPDGASVRFRYRLRGSMPRGQTSPTAMLFTPRIEKQRVFLLGPVSLVQPKGSPGFSNATYRLRWRGLPEAWQTATSFSTERTTTIDGGFRELQRSMLYAGGDLRVLHREVRGKPVHLAIAGSWKFDDETLMEIVTRILRAERKFFDDHDQPYFLVGVVPVHLKGTPLEGQDLASGTGLHQSFATFLVPEQTSLEGTKAFKVKHLLAHELFHNWNGPQLLRTPSEDEATVYWFTEGFTEHFARELLLDAGLIDREQYLEDLNEQIGAYYTNPLQNATNERLAETFWTSEHGRKLAYQRGALLALWIDHEIRRRSGGEKSLADLMRHLHRTDQTTERHPNERIFEAVATFTNPSFATTVRRHVSEGTTLELEAGYPGACYGLQQTTRKTREFGFAVEKSLTSRTLQGIESGSPAEEAGLKNGQCIVGLQKVRDEKGIALRIRVATESGTATRRIRPTVTSHRVPQYTYDASNCPESSGTGGD